MHRRLWSAALTFTAAAVLIVPPALATHTPPVARAYLATVTPAAMDFQGSATSGLRIFVNGKMTVYTRIIDVVPGEAWSVRLFDLGTCASPRHLVATLADVRIGGGGIGSRTSALDATERRLLLDALARGRRVSVRIAHGGRVACARFERVPADHFEPRRPKPAIPSFRPTPPVPSPNPFPTFSPPAQPAAREATAAAAERVSVS